jgi:tetratricopeptide (TPR) repeat protein
LSYQIIPNVVFILSVLGILLIILRRLPEAANLANHPENSEQISEKLSEKGLPVQAISGIKAFFKLWTQKVWHFVLEAKDLKPTAVAGYKIRKMFRQQPKEQTALQKLQGPKETKDEKFFLGQIKLDPKNLANYDALGKYYIDGKNYADAKDIYIYLNAHAPQSPDYNARLASCYFHTQAFAKAAEHYEKSIALDSTQPNRYYNLGLSHMALHKYEPAVDAFRRAIGLEPENSKYYISLSNSYLKLEEYDKARESLRQAENLDPENEIIQAKIKALPEEEKAM